MTWVLHRIWQHFDLLTPESNFPVGEEGAGGPIHKIMIDEMITNLE